MTLRSVLLAHLLLAVAPLGRALAPSDISGMPIHFVLVAISVSQVMLLSIYVGMFVAPTRSKIMVAAIGIAYIAVWQSIGEGLDASNPPRGYASRFSVGMAYLQLVRGNVSVFVVFAVVVACVRRLIGSIRKIPESAPSATIKPRSQYSLLALQLLLAIAALVMALARASRLSPGPSHMISFDFALSVVVFGINIVATVWATLGIGPVLRKLAFVVAVSALLGLTLAVSSSHDKLGWWVMMSFPLFTIVSTAVIASTLYSLRLSGFRLEPFAAKPD
jgi:hypothetical protein